MMTRFLTVLLLLAICLSTVDVARGERKPGFFSSITQRLFGLGRKTTTPNETARPPASDQDTAAGAAAGPADGNQARRNPYSSRRGAANAVGWGSHSPLPLVTQTQRPAVEPPTHGNVAAPAVAGRSEGMAAAPAAPPVVPLKAAEPTPAIEPTLVAESQVSEAQESPTQRWPETVAETAFAAQPQLTQPQLTPDDAAPEPREVATQWLKPPVVRRECPAQPSRPLTLATKFNYDAASTVSEPRPTRADQPPASTALVLENPHRSRMPRATEQVTLPPVTLVSFDETLNVGQAAEASPIADVASDRSSGMEFPATDSSGGEAFATGRFTGEAFVGEAFVGENLSDEARTGEAANGEAANGEAANGASLGEPMTRVGLSDLPAATPLPVTQFAPAREPESEPRPGVPQVFQKVRGTVVDGDVQSGWLRVRLQDNARLPAGEPMQIIARTPRGRMVKAIAVSGDVTAEGLLQARLQRLVAAEMAIEAGDLVEAWGAVEE